MIAHWYGGTAYRMSAERMLLMEVGVHYIDLARFLAGSDVRRVYATVGRGERSLATGDTWATVTLTLESGAAVSLVLTGEASGSDSNWGAKWLIQGDDGVISVNEEPRSLMMYSHKWGGRTGMTFPAEFYSPTTNVTFQQPLRSYYARWTASGTFPVSGVEHFNTLATVLAAYQSAASGEAADVETL